MDPTSKEEGKDRVQLRGIVERNSLSGKFRRARMA